MDEVEFDLAIPYDNASDHQLGHSALFLQTHFRPARVKIHGLGHDLFA